MPTPITATIADPAQSSQAEPSGSSDGVPAAAAELRRAVVVPDLLGAPAVANLLANGLRSPALAEPEEEEDFEVIIICPMHKYLCEEGFV